MAHQIESPSNGARVRSLRLKALRLARVLERTLGVPRQPRRLAAPLDMLIATILSQNTNDRNSHRAYTRLRKRFSTWEAVAKAPVHSIRTAIRSGGMANQKSTRIKEILDHIRGRYGRYNLAALKDWQTEEVLLELTSLKGVGVKTAACVLLFSLGRDVFPVDTHVHRICGRLGLTPDAKSPEETFHRMRELVPKGRAYSFHTNLIRFGRKICRAQNPLCELCPLYDECSFVGKERSVSRRPGRTSEDHDFMLLDNV